MGGLISAQRAAARARAKKARSNRIDRMIEEDKKRLQRTCNVLVLGSRKSGKSTILKQLRILDQGGLSKAELAEFRPVVYKNVLESAQALVTFMRETGIELDAAPGSPQNPHFSHDIADAIYQLLQDPIVLEVMIEHSERFDLMDNAEYFFNRVSTIGAPEYMPNDADVLHAYREDTTFTEVGLSMGQLQLRVIDASFKNSTRRKWIHAFESVTSIIFCASLNDYDRVFLEDKSQNQLQEAIVLFESVINSRWFIRSSVVLYLNKIDLFKKKLPKSPLERYFPEYTGGDDMNKGAKYILWRFMQGNRSRLSVYPHLTQATEATTSTSSVHRLLFSAVKETILQNALKDRNVL